MSLSESNAPGSRDYRPPTCLAYTFALQELEHRRRLSGAVLKRKELDERRREDLLLYELFCGPQSPAARGRACASAPPGCACQRPSDGRAGSS